MVKPEDCCGVEQMDGVYYLEERESSIRWVDRYGMGGDVSLVRACCTCGDFKSKILSVCKACVVRLGVLW